MMSGNVASNIRRLRQEANLTQQKLADLAGVSSVKMIEAGLRAGRISTLERIARALGVPLAVLFEGPKDAA